jgi:hypothetical protein
MTGTSTTYPSSVTVLEGEELPLGIDLGPLLRAGQTFATPTSYLEDVTDDDPGAPVALVGAPTLTGTVVTQNVQNLMAGHTYRLTLGATAAVGTIWKAGTILVCPFGDPV